VTGNGACSRQAARIVKAALERHRLRLADVLPEAPEADDGQS
jgi:hypothetical protein